MQTLAQIVLASGSPYRKKALARLGLDFCVIQPAADETPGKGESAAALCTRLALLKARTVAARHAECTVIGGDQVLDADGRILGKPGTEEASREQLRYLSGRSGTFHTAIAVIRGAFEKISVERTAVTWRALSAHEIDTYIRREPAHDCAGAAKIEGLGVTLLAGLRGNDPTALLGVPLISLCATLRELGYQLP